MNKNFVKLLRCPASGQDLQLEVKSAKPNGCVEEGELFTADRAHTYPIIRGIPRFVSSDKYANSFSKEWAKWANVQYEEQNVNSPMHNHTTNMFNRISQLPDNAIKDKIVVEFGCGGGRFIDVVRKKGGIAIGIDLSTAVEQSGYNFRNDENVLIVQGDILNAPFKDNVFDVGYTIGVLHHTPDPQKGFDELSRVTRQGGEVVCCVYAKGSYYDYQSVYKVRRFINKTEPVFGNKLALLYSYISAHIFFRLFPRIAKISTRFHNFIWRVERYHLPVLYLPDAKWRVLDVYDSITPVYASTHSVDEITSWFQKAGFSNIEKTDWGNCAFKGKKN